jgi:hypothetical protein
VGLDFKQTNKGELIMKKFLGFVLLVCLFAVPRIFAATDDANTDIIVVDPVCVYAISAQSLGVYVNDADVTYSPPREIKFKITATDGNDITYTTTKTEPTNAPQLTCNGLGTFHITTTGGLKYVYVYVTDAACNGAPAGTYTYTFTCTADYTSI